MSDMLQKVMLRDKLRQLEIQGKEDTQEYRDTKDKLKRLESGRKGGESGE